MNSQKFLVSFTESPVGVKFGHQLSGTSLVAFSVNPARTAHRLGVEKGDEALEINGRPVKDSEASLEFFRSLCRGKQFPIQVVFLRERLIDVQGSIEAHMEKKKVEKIRQAEQAASFNAPPTLHAEVSYGGLWFPATVQKLAGNYYHATFLYSDLAVQHDLVGQNSTIPEDRVQLSTVESIKESWNDFGSSSVAAFESLQTGLTEDPMGYLGEIGKTSVNASVSWVGSWFESEPEAPAPEENQPKKKQQPPPEKSIYFNDDPSDQAAYPVFSPPSRLLEEDTSEVTDFSRMESSELLDDERLLQHFLEESSKLKAQLQAELAKEVGDL